MRILTTAVFLTILVECCFGFVDMPWGKLRDKNVSSYYSSRIEECEVPSWNYISVWEDKTKLNDGDRISAGTRLIISCNNKATERAAYTEERDTFPYHRTNVIRKEELKVKCLGNNMLEDVDDKADDYKKGPFRMLSIKCVRHPNARYTGESCLDKYDFIEIAPRIVENNFDRFGDPQIKICFDKETKRTLYVKHTITLTENLPENELSEYNSRPDFATGIFFCPIRDVLQYYKKNIQRQNINRLLGVPPVDSEMYIDNTNDFFLSKGHLAPAGDFQDPKQKCGTYFLVNAAPQWQVINNGNWKEIEYSLRKMKGYINKQEIVTGTHGTLEFIHDTTVQETLTPIYLYSDQKEGNKIPVPKYFWKAFKLTSTPTTKRRPKCPTKETPTSTLTSTPTDVMKGYVIVTANNPYCLEEKICTTGTDKLEDLGLFGITDNSKQLGYTFICTFEEFTLATKIDVNALFT